MKREVDEYRKLNQKLVLENKELKESHDKISGSFSSLQTDLKKAKDEIESLRNELKRKEKGFESKLALAQNASKSQTEVNAKLRGEIGDLKKKIETLKEENARLLENLNKTSDSFNTITQMQGLLDERQRKIDQLTLNNNEFIHQLNSQNEELIKWRDSYTIIKQRLDEKEGELREKVSQAIIAEATIKELRDAFAQLKKTHH